LTPTPVKGTFLSANRARCITDEVLYERSRQEDEWGEQDWSDELRAELVQVAATVVGWIEAIDRRANG